MTPRVKKLIGGVGIVVFVALYCIVASAVADYVPPYWWARLIYFLVVGTAWGLPVIPLINWMNRER